MVMEVVIWDAAAAGITMVGRVGHIAVGTNPGYRIFKEAALGDGPLVLYPPCATLALNSASPQSARQ
jgi:hypothetical protein